MKKLNVLVATIALLAASTVASAADSAWFTLEGASGDAIASSQGPGQTLVITKNGTTPQTLTIGYNLTSSTGLLAGWAIDVFATTDPGKTVDVTGFTRLGTNYNIAAGGNAPVSLLTGSFDVGAGAINADGSAGLVLTFDVLIGGKTPGSTTQIFGAFGTAEQFLSNGYVWDGSVGPNSRVYGYAGTSFGSLPVVTITNVPEPATMALLGLGVVALIRRRR